MKAKLLRKNGKREFVILAWEDYAKIQEKLEDYDDLRELREAKRNSRGQKPIPFEKVVNSLKLKK